MKKRDIIKRHFFILRSLEKRKRSEMFSRVRIYKNIKRDSCLHCKKGNTLNSKTRIFKIPEEREIHCFFSTYISFLSVKISRK